MEVHSSVWDMCLTQMGHVLNTCETLGSIPSHKAENKNPNFLKMVKKNIRVIFKSRVLDFPEPEKIKGKVNPENNR